MTRTRRRIVLADGTPVARASERLRRISTSVTSATLARAGVGENAEVATARMLLLRGKSNRKEARHAHIRLFAPRRARARRRRGLRPARARRGARTSVRKGERL